MKVSLIDYNSRGMETMIDSLGICRGNACTQRTLEGAIIAKPVPHLSVLEFGWACVLVQGVSIKTRIQLLRSRLFSTMERSSRSINLKDVDAVMPNTVGNTDLFEEFYETAFENYVSVLDDGESLEDAAYLLPLATETEFYLAGNMRTFYEYFQKRLCKKHVQDEHYQLAMRMWRVLRNEFPILITAHPCDNCGACSGNSRE